METLKKSVFLFTLCIMTGIFSFGQSQNSDSLKNVVNAMAHSNIYEVSYNVGYTGIISQQFLRFKQLLSLATDEQLLDIAANNKNAVVRLYAYQALKQKKIEIPTTLIQQFKDDKTIVKMLNGCILDKKSLNTLYQQNLTSFFFDLSN